MPVIAHMKKNETARPIGWKSARARSEGEAESRSIDACRWRSPSRPKRASPAGTGSARRSP